MLPAHVADDIGSIKVVLGAFAVCLRTSTDECSRNHGLEMFVITCDRPIKVPHQKSQLIDEPGRKQMPVTDVDLVFLAFRVVTRLAKNNASDILILVRLALVRIPDPELVAVRKVVKHSS